MQKVLFTVGLSNGENIYEGKGNFQIKEGELSPWQRLLNYLEENDLSITSLSLYTEEGRRWNLPSAGKSPKFKEFVEVEKPTSLRMFRKFGREMTQDGQPISEDHFTVIEASYPDKKLQVWVDENSLNSWSMVI